MEAWNLWKKSGWKSQFENQQNTTQVVKTIIIHEMAQIKHHFFNGIIFYWVFLLFLTYFYPYHLPNLALGCHGTKNSFRPQVSREINEAEPRFWFPLEGCRWSWGRKAKKWLYALAFYFSFPFSASVFPNSCCVCST